VDSYLKKVQHPTGGVVGELLVRDGTEVRAGDVLVRLDETVTRANLAVITKSMDELAARQARLKAEQDAGGELAFPNELIAREPEPEIGRLMKEERRLFQLRRLARQGQKAQLSERTAQLREQIHGMLDQITAKQRELELVSEELRGVRDLWQKNLVQITRVMALEREAAGLGGERASLVASVAQAKGKITETELQILQVDQDLRTEVGKELAEIRGKLAELGEKRIAAEDQLKRTDIRAPQDGIVHELSVHTVGGVVSPGEALMVIVPRADKLTVEARIAPQDIDHVRVGHRAVLRFSAFNLRTTPELNGEVTFVSADITKDDKANTSFYTVRIVPPPSELARLKDLKLVPGMPVETFINTGERTVISYLTKPLQDQLKKAWREKN
jgi:HlyD family secretion protein